MVKYEYTRFYAPGDDEYETLEQAMHRAAHDIDYNEAYPVQITDGETVYNHDQIWAYLEAHGMLA